MAVVGTVKLSDIEKSKKLNLSPEYYLGDPEQARKSLNTALATQKSIATLVDNRQAELERQEALRVKSNARVL